MPDIIPFPRPADADPATEHWSLLVADRIIADAALPNARDVIAARLIDVKTQGMAAGMEAAEQIFKHFWERHPQHPPARPEARQ